jgi:hypothetical protein
MGIAHCCVGKGIFVTETILTMLPSGHGVLAASSTATRPGSDPSTANKIFIAFLIDFRVTCPCNALLRFLMAMRVPRKNPCLAMRIPIVLGKITNREGKNPQGDLASGGLLSVFTKSK